MSMKKHKLPIRIYFEDTDAQGVVYYANYLKFAARARAEFLREEGYSHGASFRDTNCGFVVRHCEIDYKGSARIDDLIDVYTTVVELKNASVVMEQTMCLGDKELVIVKIVLVHIDEEFKPSRIPEDIREILIEGDK